LTTRTSTEDARTPRAGPDGHGLATVPNALCVIRLLGSPALVALAWADLPDACLGLFVVLSLTDWLDGKLAKRLGQETEFGARLDTVADVTFYACMLLAVLVLRGDLIRQEAAWIIPAVLSYAVSFAAALIKYRQLPSYHTRMAKTSWLLVFIAVGAIFAGWSVWAVRIAALGVLVTNLEATLITLMLPEWRANVPSVFHARRAAGGREEGTPC
jgi:CDP-diacylglycerol--glycerol-3-phosphate 3-phosphatidyltransferase